MKTNGQLRGDVLVCEYITQDAGGRISLIDIFEQVYFPEYPATYQCYLLARLLTPQSGTHNVEILAEREGADPVMLYSQAVETQPGAGHNIIWRGNIPFQEPGPISISLVVDGVAAGGCTLAALEAGNNQ